MKDCCKHTKKDNKCRRKSDKKTFKLPRKFSKKKCRNPKGFTMRSSCAPYKDCFNKKQTKKAKKKMRGGKRNKKVIYFALGCFWGIEQKFSKMKGVITTSVGYMGGHEDKPTYEKVCSGNTGHAETVKIVYDPDIIGLKDLLREFKKIFKKKTKNTKDQYRPAIFYEKMADLPVITAQIEGIEVKKDTKFFLAETYHQKYSEKNTKIQTENLEEFKRICLNNKNKAEKKGNGKYYGLEYRGKKKKKGIYKCALCKNNLYSSEHIFNPNSGWPAFFDTIDGYKTSEVVFHDKLTKELKCMKCGIHLGHRFNRKDTVTGIHDCLNSVCLYFSENQEGGKKEFLYNPDDPKKSFDVYIDKNPKDTIPIKYKTLDDVKDTIKKLERLYKNNKYPHKRIWQVAMIMKVRLEVIKKKKTKQYNLSKKYYDFLKQRTKIKGEKERKKLKFKI